MAVDHFDLQLFFWEKKSPDPPPTQCSIKSICSSAVGRSISSACSLCQVQIREGGKPTLLESGTLLQSLHGQILNEERRAVLHILYTLSPIPFGEGTFAELLRIECNVSSD